MSEKRNSSLKQTDEQKCDFPSAVALSQITASTDLRKSSTSQHKSNSLAIKVIHKISSFKRTKIGILGVFQIKLLKTY